MGETGIRRYTQGHSARLRNLQIVPDSEMDIYPTISGYLPFYEDTDLTIS